MRKILALAAAGVLALSASAQAAAVYSWENDLQGFAGANGVTTSSVNTAGVATDGSYALQLAGVPGGWQFRAAGPWNDVALGNALRTGNILQFDVKPGSSVTDPSNLQIFIQLLGNGVGPGAWGTADVAYTSINDPSTGHTTLSFDYSTLLPAITADVGGGANLKIGTNLAFAGNVFIDNVRVVPEPASLGVLGLGALGLVARRRRA